MPNSYSEQSLRIMFSRLYKNTDAGSSDSYSDPLIKFFWGNEEVFFEVFKDWNTHEIVQNRLKGAVSGNSFLLSELMSEMSVSGTVFSRVAFIYQISSVIHLLSDGEKRDVCRWVYNLFYFKPHIHKLVQQTILLICENGDEICVELIARVLYDIMLKENSDSKATAALILMEIYRSTTKQHKSYIKTFEGVSLYPHSDKHFDASSYEEVSKDQPQKFKTIHSDSHSDAAEVVLKFDQN